MAVDALSLLSFTEIAIGHETEMEVETLQESQVCVEPCLFMRWSSVNYCRFEFVYNYNPCACFNYLHVV